MNSKSIKVNILWNSIGSMSYLLFQWLITIIISRILGFDNAGIFSLAMSTTNIFTCIALFGIRNYQVSDVDGKYTDKMYIKNRIITCIIAIIICILFTVLLSLTLEQKISIIIYMLFRAAESYADVLHGIDQKVWRMDIVGKSYFLRGISMFLVTIIFITLTHNIILTIMGMTFITTVIIFFYDNRRTNEFINVKNDNVNNNQLKLVLECLPFAIYLLMLNAMGSIPRLVLEQLKGSDMLGIYASIAAPTLIIQVFISYIFTPLVGIFADYRKNNEKNKFTKLFGRINAIIIAIAAISLIFAYFFGDFVLKILFGDKIIPYTYLLMPIILCTVLTAFSWFLCTILTVYREIKGLIVSNLIGLLIDLGISYPFIINYDLNGTSYSLIISLFIQILISFFYVLRKR